MKSLTFANHTVYGAAMLCGLSKCLRFRPWNNCYFIVLTPSVSNESLIIIVALKIFHDLLTSCPQQSFYFPGQLFVLAQ